jgi:hypothetical protein
MLKRMRLISCLAFAAGCMFWMTGSAQAQWIPRPAEPPAEAEVQPGEQDALLPPDGPQPSGQLDAEFPAEPPTTQSETGQIGRAHV